MKNRIISLVLLLQVIILFSACRVNNPKSLNKNFNYFQAGLDSNRKIKINPLVAVPNDQLSIQVSSSTMNQDQVAIFNSTNSGLVQSTISGSNQGTGGGGGIVSQQNQQMTQATMGFLVDTGGKISYPMLGKIKVGGKTRDEIATLITDSLSEKGYVKDPVVQVRFLQLKVNVLGEVKAPGIKTFTSDRITLLDAISACGDLTDFGRRDNITIIREINGVQKTIVVNLLNADFMSTEGYQLQQNDVVYVYANNNKLKETGFDPKTTHDLQVYGGIVSLMSFVITIFLLFK